MTMTQDRTDERPTPPNGVEPVVLATYGLTKSFGATLAVDHLDLTVRRGALPAAKARENAAEIAAAAWPRDRSPTLRGQR